MSPLILTTVKSPLCHLPHTAPPHQASAQPLLDLAPASALHTCLQFMAHTDQVTLSKGSDLCTAPCCPQSLSRGPPGPSTAWPHSAQHSTAPATHSSAISRMCCFQAGRTSPTHLKNETNCCVMSLSKQDFLFKNSLSWGPDPKNNHLVLTLTPRHSQDPSKHGKAPYTAPVAVASAVGSPTRKKRPSSNGRF